MGKADACANSPVSGERPPASHRGRAAGRSFRNQITASFWVAGALCGREQTDKPRGARRGWRPPLNLIVSIVPSRVEARRVPRNTRLVIVSDEGRARGGFGSCFISFGHWPMLFD